MDFVKKCGEITMKMMISDPPLLFDCTAIGHKVAFSQHKQDSLDGFIKAGEECFVILPPVYKLTASAQVVDQKKAPTTAKTTQKFQLQSTSIIGNVAHLASAGQPIITSKLHADGTSSQDQLELVFKPNVLPLNYEFS